MKQILHTETAWKRISSAFLVALVAIMLMNGQKAYADNSTNLYSIAPVITQPYIDFSYPVGSDGAAFYAVYYNCPFNVSRVLLIGDWFDVTENAGLLRTSAAGDAPQNMSCTFVARDTSLWVESNAVDYPHYGRVYSCFKANSRPAVTDAAYSMHMPRYTVLDWSGDFFYYGPYENESDFMPTDVFEIQRAYHRDFSDASTIALVPLTDTVHSEFLGSNHYVYTDSVEEAWWNPVEHNYNVYYRIRRASSAGWGWTGHAYASEFKYVYMPTFVPFTTSLMPFAEEEQHGTYTKAADFEQSRKVEFTIDLYATDLLMHFYSRFNPFDYEDVLPFDSAYWDSIPFSPTYWDKNQKLVIQKILEEYNDTILLEVPHDSIEAAIKRAALTCNDSVDSAVVHVHYVDYANTPCVHYSYRTYIDTTNVVVKHGLDVRPYYLSAPLIGEEIYFTEAANISTFHATNEDYSDHVLLTWEPTDGEVGLYTVETRPKDSTEWHLLADSLTVGWYRDYYANPEISFDWDYRLTMTYTCNGNTKSSTQTISGSRLIYGSVSGHILYEDGTGCPGITVTASRVDSDDVVRTAVTDETGAYMLDSLPYMFGVEYSIVPTSQTAEFRYNNTSAASATERLTQDRCIVEGIDFENISCVRFSGRVLYENSTIPVRDANFLVNGRLLKNGNVTYQTDASGDFQFNVPKGAGFTLQVIKDGHRFAGDGFVRIDGDSVLTLDSPLDGVRIYDQTKVRLIGRLAGGNNQAQKTLGFGLSTNYLGDDLQMVFELEGDNISQIVHVPSDLTITEIDTTLQHVVSDSLGIDTVGATSIVYYKKRIIVRPDLTTGEYAVDLFPVKYKITQATARGYSTLYADGKMGETLDLTDAPLRQQTFTNEGKDVQCNETYSITYHSPINISCIQQLNGMDVDYYGETNMVHRNKNGQNIPVQLATKQVDGSYTYLFGAPVFAMTNYSFRVTAHEDYYYNNNPASAIHEEVRLHNGTLKVYNDMYEGTNTEIQTRALDINGEAIISVPVNNVSFIKTGVDALRGIDLSVEYEGDYIENQTVRGYIIGNKRKGEEFVTYNAANDNIVLLDILRDPPGANSYAYLEKGASYTYTYSSELDIDAGVELSIGAGTNTDMTVGVFAGVGAGSFTGFTSQMSNVYTVTLNPAQLHYYKKNLTSYTFTTNERIETGRDAYSVGTGADVYIGVAQNAYYALTDAVKPIDAVTYAKLQPQIANGTIKVVTQGTDDNGAPFYLVIGTETEIGTYFKSSFTYTGDYIENTIIPQLLQQRDALDPSTADSTKIKAFNNTMAQWMMLLLENEREKIAASLGSDTIRQDVGRWSVGGITTVSHDDSYAYAQSYGSKLDWPGLSVDFSQLGGSFGKSMQDFYNNKLNNKQPSQVMNGTTPAMKFSFGLAPVFDMARQEIPANDSTFSRKTGFVLQTDPYGHMDVTVCRVIAQEAGFNKSAKEYREDKKSKDGLYGSYVYKLNGGASRCPWEPAEYTRFYTPRMTLSDGTLKLENQKLDINVHERSDVPADQAAIFNLRIANEGEMPYGDGNSPITFYLKLKEGSNPKGAKIQIDGMPLTGEGRPLRLVRGDIINKTMEVYAGEGYDFEDIVLVLESPCDINNQTQCTFSVHYTPVACSVHITAPHDQWVLNTLSPKDSTGWYLPVVIDGYDVNYKGFDHIELQYKLATQSDDDWVNLCSYYAQDSLYRLASGNKAMINGGRIENIRFYGERDPMEQQYNLRAVAYCRYGSGLINRTSSVLSGTKDTRCPRVFGEPQPVDAILRVGDNLSLRFNEAIAGNYLDEDNNFQVLGTTNASGITTSTSLHYDGTDDSYAATQINRSLANKSFSLDMIVLPENEGTNSVFFRHGEKGLVFGLDASNRLYAQWGNNGPVYSKPLSTITDFTRVVCAYNHNKNELRFFAGTEEMTDSTAQSTISSYNVSAPLIFGRGFDGNMLEVRVWGKALGLAEIAETHMKRLNGSELGLEDYYPMNEGRGYTLTDKASGASLVLNGTAWNLNKGISMHLDGTQPLTLNSDVLSRSEIQDVTLMLWFKTAEAKGTLFSAGREQSAKTGKYAGTAIRFDDGVLKLESDTNTWTIGAFADDEWHHLVLSISRTFNHTAVFVDGNMTNTFAATMTTGISGEMFLGADGYKGYVDDLAMFEQALPKALILNYDNTMLSGQEMGLMGYLPFEERKENDNGIMETVFSPNDQREFRDSEGNVVNKIVPLVLTVNADAYADKTNSAPIREQEMLTKLNYEWAFNGDELLINLKMHDYEINKQNIYVTVRDVEDLRGNPMASPVTWTAYVDRNTLKWGNNSLSAHHVYGEDSAPSANVAIINTSGKRHQFTVESLPDWLTLSDSYGTLEPEAEKTLTFTFDQNAAVGHYSAVIYLTDENSLSEPLSVDYTVEAIPPYDVVDRSKYTLSMSVCGQVLADNAVYDTDDEDRVIALYRNECVGMANVNANADIYLTIFGNESMNGKTVNFVLWKASTGKVLSLTPSQQILFTNNSVYGCGNDQPVLFTIGGSETQNIALNAGWNWISFNVDVQEAMSPLNTVMTASQPWAEGDIIKNPSTQKFVTYSHDKDAFVGTFEAIDYRYMYMAYSKNGNLMRVSANTLPADSMHITLHGNGQWTAFPCLLSDITSVTEALADYYDHAAAGDLIKAHDRFAVFSADKHWVGDLTALRPGEGYLFKRLATDDMTVRFFDKPQSNAPKKAKTNADNAAFTNPNAATNMTMIARVDMTASRCDEMTSLRAYIGDDLVGVATPIDSLYFLTIQSDVVGTLRFETEDGTVLTPVEVSTSRSLEITYQANAHHGSLKAPIIFKSSNPQIFKLIEKNHVIIIRNNEKYDVTGKKL